MRDAALVTPGRTYAQASFAAGADWRRFALACAAVPVTGVVLCFLFVGDRVEAAAQV